MLEHQAEFVNALRSGKMRERLFDTMEQYCAHDFGNGRLGKGFYEQLLSAVRAAGSQEAIKEFESRFSPFLNPHQKHLNAGDVGHLGACPSNSGFCWSEKRESDSLPPHEQDIPRLEDR